MSWSAFQTFLVSVILSPNVILWELKYIKHRRIYSCWGTDEMGVAEYCVMALAFKKKHFEKISEAVWAME